MYPLGASSIKASWRSKHTIPVKLLFITTYTAYLMPKNKHPHLELTGRLIQSDENE